MMYVKLFTLTLCNFCNAFFSFGDSCNSLQVRQMMELSSWPWLLGGSMGCFEATDWADAVAVLDGCWAGASPKMVKAMRRNRHLIRTGSK